MTTVHVLGAGLAGLAAAVHALERGAEVRVYEAAGQAGGRCRSFHEPALDRVVDNGTHLVLGANRDVFAYLESLGVRDRLVPVAEPAAFAFVDIASGARWTVRPTAGRLPWWLLAPSRSVPGLALRDLVAAWRLRRSPPDATLAQRLDTRRPVFERFWRPLCHAVLNTPADTASAALMARVLDLAVLGGEAAMRPYLSARSLADTFVSPAVARLGDRLATGQRIRRIATDGGRATGLEIGETAVAVGDAKVIVALPGPVAGRLVPGITAPVAHNPIVNVHYRTGDGPSLPEGRPMLGIVGGTAEWAFRRGDILSVTVSAADALLPLGAPEIAGRIWDDLTRALDAAGAALPPYRVIKEKRATFAQTPSELARRPGSETGLANLFLAGDWTDTGLPATLDGAIRSGRRAAALALA